MISCDIVKDLLPLYTDKCISQATKQSIASHLKHCEKCRKYYKDILRDKKRKKNMYISSDNIEIPDFKCIAKKMKAKKMIKHFIVFTLIAATSAFALFNIFSSDYNKR